MRFTTPAIVVALRPHGEHGAIVRLMTAGQGLQAGYVRGARGRRLRPVLISGNIVEAQLSSVFAGGKPPTAKLAGLTAFGLTTLVVFVGLLVGLAFLIKAVFF